MGIDNIHILIEPQWKQEALQAQAAREAVLAALIAEHRRGNHPWGSMRRDCPLCQAGN